jgi:tripartite-type tricarboxylate transporter receptor subunit TctC
MIMPYPAGGSTDIIGRVIADHLGTALGTPIFVENRVGASALIGTEIAAKSAPDGYTLVMFTSTNAINQSMRTNLPYDINTSFQSIAMVCNISQVLVVPTSVPTTTLREFTDFAKKSQGKLNYSSSGAGTAGHLAMESLKSRGGFDITHIPYKGNAPALNDLISAQVTAGFINVVTALPLIKTGKLRPLAISGPTRHVLLPDIPTIAESGYPGYTVISWFGLAAPVGLPPDVSDRLESEMAKILKRDDVRKRFQDLGVEQPSITTAKQMTEFLKRDVGHWAELMKIAGVKPE